MGPVIGTTRSFHNSYHDHLVCKRAEAQHSSTTKEAFALIGPHPPKASSGKKVYREFGPVVLPTA